MQEDRAAALMERHLRRTHDSQSPEPARRELLRLLGYTPPVALLAIAGCRTESRAQEELQLASASEARNVFELEPLTRQKLDRESYDFIAGGADDLKTVRANREAFDQFQIRARRLVDVSQVDTRVDLFGEILETPILLAPVGTMQIYHPEGDLAVARAAAAKGHVLIASTVSSAPIEEITAAGKKPHWFQLYPTRDRALTRALLDRAEAAGCSVVALTVDTPVTGNREKQIGVMSKMLESGRTRLGNFDGIETPGSISDPTLSWDIVGWLKARTSMKVLLKGIVTREDARRSVENGADGLIVSNHGGRQEESNRGTMECLTEVMEGVGGRLPVLIDGGFRRGTDVFKALALGARAICIGRPYLWGLAAFGQTGVERVLELLHAELVRIMQLAGTPSLKDITGDFVTRKCSCK